ncbi:Uncharacterised protein [Klebsiella variicola]|uniref:Uncharacterized protein n=1 Tax=Klebsiella variicola TaxID=244366 RepID=A0A7H4MNM2_KLEVA|nr:Uncharacterised protein [Klebsiella variicola]
MAFIGILLGDADGVVEDRLVIDDMVGGEDQHQRVVAVAGGLEGRQGDAGAVLRPTGSRIMLLDSLLSWRSCSATRKRCSSLQMTIGHGFQGPRVG